MNGDLLLKVKHSRNRLYKTILRTAEQGWLLSKIKDKNWLWHSHFGHVNFKALTTMSTTKMVSGLPKIIQPKEVCAGCLMSKQTKKGFPQQTEFHAKKALELIHGDLCGPITPSTSGGNRYIYLIVDDFTRVM